MRVALLFVFCATSAVAQSPRWQVSIPHPVIPGPTAVVGLGCDDYGSLVRNAQGDVFAVSCPAYVNGPAGTSTLAVAKLDGTTGAQQWRKVFTTPGTSFIDYIINLIALDANGDVIVATIVYSEETAQFTDLVKYSAVTGDLIWQQEYPLQESLATLANGDIRLGSMTIDGGTGLPKSDDNSPALDNNGGVPLTGGGRGFIARPIDNDNTRQISMYENVALPGKPRVTSSSKVNTFVSLSFLPPADDGGSPIIDYQFFCGANGYGQIKTYLASPVSMSLDFIPPYTTGLGAACRVSARNIFGYGATSDDVTFQYPGATPPALISAASRKTHANAGVFELPISMGVAQSGAVTIEPRADSVSGHLVVLRFSDSPLNNAVQLKIGSAGIPFGLSTTVVDTELRVIIPPGTIPDRSRVTITGSTGTVPSFSVSLGFLGGDVNGTGNVDAADAAIVRASSGQRLTLDNMRYDINSSGSVTAADVSSVKARAGQVLLN